MRESMRFAGCRKASALVLILGLSLLCSCVTSKQPLLGPDSRVLPFAPPMKFEVYEREPPGGPWQKQSEGTLVADRDLEAKGESSNETYTFHALGLSRYIVQGRFGDGYAYGVLEVRNGEGFLSSMPCKNIDLTAFRAAGGTAKGGDASNEECQLDGAKNPLELLLQLAAKPAEPDARYVPVRQ